MKLWTMVAGLVIAGVVASSVFAQDAPKRGKRGQLPAWKDLVGDKTTLDKPTFVAALTKNVTDESKKDAATTRAAQVGCIGDCRRRRKGQGGRLRLQVGRRFQGCRGQGQSEHEGQGQGQ